MGLLAGINRITGGGEKYEQKDIPGRIRGKAFRAGTA